MINHNATLAVSTISLTPEQIIGASVNWKLTHMPVPYALVVQAYNNNNIDIENLPDPTTGLARFRELCQYQFNRTSYRDDNGSKRDFVNTVVKHADSHLISYTYGVNVAEATEKARVIPVGTITYNTNNDIYHWRFVTDHRLPNESVSDYIVRCHAGMPAEVRLSDCEYFNGFASSLLAEVDQYVSGTNYDIVKLRDILKQAFIDYGCFTLSQRGGFWFAPRTTGDSTCPFTNIINLVRAFESINEMAGIPENDSISFMLLTMPKDTATVNAAASVVQENLLDKVNEISDAIDKIKEVTRSGQHNSRINELARIVATAELYRDMLGMTTDALQDRISEVMQIINNQTSNFSTNNIVSSASGKVTVRATGKLNESRVWKMLTALEIGDKMNIDGAWAERTGEKTYRGNVCGINFDGRKMDAIHALRKAVYGGAMPAENNDIAGNNEADDIAESHVADNADNAMHDISAFAQMSTQQIGKLVGTAMRTGTVVTHVCGNYRMDIITDDIKGGLLCTIVTDADGKFIHQISATDKLAMIDAIRNIPAQIAA